MNLLRGKLELDRMYQKEFAIHTEVINTQHEVIELGLKKTIGTAGWVSWGMRKAGIAQ
jgi:hypothetical protein